MKLSRFDGLELVRRGEKERELWEIGESTWYYDCQRDEGVKLHFRQILYAREHFYIARQSSQGV